MKAPKRFVVGIPVTGAMTIEVLAQDEASAIARAWELFNEHGHAEAGFDVTWEATSNVTTGNVCHAELNSEYAEELKP